MSETKQVLFVRIPETLVASPAYQTLGSNSKLLIEDVLHYKNLASDFGRRPELVQRGFEYTFTLCRHADVTRSAFYRALGQLVDHGFVSRVDDRPGFLRVIKAWRDFRPPPALARRLMKRLDVADRFRSVDARSWWVSACVSPTHQTEFPCGLVQRVLDGSRPTGGTVCPTSGTGREISRDKVSHERDKVSHERDGLSHQRDAKAG